MLKQLGSYDIDIRPEGEYLLFDEQVTGEELLEYEFDYLQELDCLILSKLLLRIDEIPMTFHPEVYQSLLEDKEQSPYFKKRPEEIKVIYRKESTKDITKNKEQNLMKKPVNENDQFIRNKKYTAVNMLVKQGYDRVFCRDVMKKYSENNGTGYLNLTPKRISEIIDSEIQKNY